MTTITKEEHLDRRTPVRDSHHNPSRSGSRTTSSRLIGSLFLAGFLVYGTGAATVSSLTGGQRFLATVGAHRTLLVLGVFLMLLNTAVDVGKGVLFYPVLARHGVRTALVYLSALIVEVVLLSVGNLALLMLVPLADSQDGGGTGPAAASAQRLADLAVDANAMAYQVAQLVLAVGALFMATMLFRTRLVPRMLAGLGVIGYALHASGAIAEIFDVHISLFLLGPGAVFELGLGVWLLTKGFAAAPFGQPAIAVPATLNGPVPVVSTERETT